MYKAIVVDDEYIIRNGLEKVVDWNSLGFELLGSFEDGTDAVDFIDHNSVDLVITDIKMTEMSGLELAKYIRQQQPETSVIILTGYSDFSFAQESIKYGVSEYLLKPLELKEFNKILSKIKNNLDNDYQRKERNNELISEVRSQLIDEIMASAICNNDNLKRRLRLAGINESLVTKPCALVQIKIINSEIWNYGSKGLCNAVENISHCCLKDITPYVFASGENVFILISYNSDLINNLEKTIEDYTKAVLETFYNVLKITIDIDTILSKIGVLGLNRSEIVSSEQFEKQKRLIVSYVNAGDLKGAKELFDGVIENFDSTQIKEAKHF